MRDLPVAFSGCYNFRDWIVISGRLLFICASLVETALKGQLQWSFLAIRLVLVSWLHIIWVITSQTICF